MWTKSSRCIIRQPGAGSSLVRGAKPGTPSEPLGPSFRMSHEAPESDHCPFAERVKVFRGEEITAGHLAAFFESITPVMDYVHFSGQRWKDPSKLTTNTMVTITQRLHVVAYMIYPWILGFKTMVELGAHLGVCKSMIMRHVKDFNVTFGIYGLNQKRVSCHGDVGSGVGSYVEAAFKGHETRRRRQAEAWAARGGAA